MKKYMITDLSVVIFTHGCRMKLDEATGWLGVVFFREQIKQQNLEDCKWNV